MALVPDVTIVFELSGEQKRLELKRVPFSTWQSLKRELGFTPLAFIGGLADDVEAIGSLIWLERRQNEPTLAWAAIRRELESADIEYRLVDIVDNQKEVKVEDPLTPAGS